MVVRDVQEVLLANVDVLYQNMVGWSEDEKKTFLSEFPYFLQSEIKELGEIVPEALTVDYLLAMAIGAIKVINDLKRLYEQPFKGFGATASEIGWRPLLTNGKDIKATIPINATGAGFYDYVGEKSTTSIMRLSKYHGVVIWGLLPDSDSITNKYVAGYKFWDTNSEEYPKFFGENIHRIAQEFGVILFPEVKYYKPSDGIGLQLYLTAGSDTETVAVTVAPLGIAIGLVDQYLSMGDNPTWTV